MLKTDQRRRRACARILALSLTLQAMPAVAPAAPVPVLALNAAATVTLQPGATLSRRLPKLAADRAYSVSVALTRPAGLSASTPAAEVRLQGPGHEPLTKSLNAGDPDWFFTYAPRAAGDATLSVHFAGAAAQPVRLEVRALPLRAADVVRVEREPNDSWQQANALPLGKTVWAGADDMDYLGPTRHVDTVSWPADPEERGADWYRFTYTGPKSLCQFNIELLDRDVPPNIRVFRQEKPGAEPLEYAEGKDPVEIRHDMQVDLNFKHVTRVLTPGTYFVEVRGRHPFYQLQTKLYPAPPYTDPRQAVRTATDYVLNSGDSWFANTPRAGAVRYRILNVSDETERCVACHPSQFSTRAALNAFQNGYDIKQRWQLRYLMERFYNAEAPFYGVKDSHWVRSDLAPNNALSRTADIIRMYENGLSKQPTDKLRRALGFVRASWVGRTELPAEEFDGNLPISSFKIASDIWSVAGELHRREGAAEDRALQEQIRGMMLTAKPKDVQELMDQTLALIEIDRQGFAETIRTNVEKIVAAQHEDGGWTRGYAEAKSVPSLQFMTGQGIYTLTRAGHRDDHPTVARALKLLLSQQQPFGGWQDQKGEPFITPFLESKWAIRALSQLYPGPGRRDGWASTATRVREPGTAGLMDTLDDIEAAWDQPAAPVTARLRELAGHPEAFVRWAALAALGRVGGKADVAAVTARLNDPVKPAWRAAAWAARQLGNRGAAVPQIRQALRAPDERTRRGATRVFAQLFYHMQDDAALAEQVVGMVDDPDYLTRIQAEKAAWRWFYRTRDLAFQGRIADRILARLSGDIPQGERINVEQALHNILDDNLRLFESRWVPRLHTDAQKAAANAGWDERQKMLVGKLVTALGEGSRPQRDSVLRTMGFNFQRPRIGNDTDMLEFTRPETARTFLTALRPYLSNPEVSVRRLAVRAASAGNEGETEEAVRALMQGLTDTDKTVREDSQRSLARFAVKEPIASSVRPDLLALLQSPAPEARVGGLNAILTHPTLHKQPLVEPVIAAYEGAPTPEVRAEAVRNLSWVYDTSRDPRALNALRTSAADGALQGAVIEALRGSALRNGALIKRQEALDLIRTLAASPDAQVRVVALDVLRRSTALRRDPRIIPILRHAVSDALPRVRLAAVQQLQPFLTMAPSRPEAESAIRVALADGDEPTRTAAAGALGVPVPKVSAAVAAQGAAGARPDFDYFAKRVQPIFVKKSGDGAACYSCHSTHAVLRIAQPDKLGRLTPAQMKQNYESALKVVDLQIPESSLLLRKPLSPTENPPPGFLTHAGGPRWPRGLDSEEYRTLLAWIKGAKLDGSAPAAKPAARTR